MHRFQKLILPSLIMLTACSDSNSGSGQEPEVPPLVEESGFVYTLKPDKKMGEISPYIYGMNLRKEFSHTSADYSTLVRLGGNRLTGYNWENNASNAGSDWHHSSDSHIPNQMVKGSDTNIPGSVASAFVSNCLDNGQTPLFTIPMCYYVAADKNGEVAEGDMSRWLQNKPVKPSAFSQVPDLTDGVVYADECVNFIANVCGAKGRVAYSLDNEPDLWQSTHPRICQTHISCKDFLDRTIDYAKAIKNVDGKAEIYGFASFGYSGYSSFSSAPDWNSVKGNYRWFIDYYLDRVQRASDLHGTRLVDVLDLHWYPEAKGDNRINQSTANTDKDRKARLQAPRSLWDESYREDSWIAQQSNCKLPLIPNVRKSIDRYAPGSKLAFTEFNYGGYEDITGTIALAEVLGIFGKYDVYAACHWGDPGTYGNLAYRLYRDYDGAGSRYGDTLVESSLNKTWVNSSVFASVEDGNGARLHAVVSNKSFEETIEAKIRIDSGREYREAEVYYVTDGMARIQKSSKIEIKNNRFTYSLPPLSVAHIVITH